MIYCKPRDAFNANQNFTSLIRGERQFAASASGVFRALVLAHGNDAGNAASWSLAARSLNILRNVHARQGLCSYYPPAMSDKEMAKR